MIFNQVDLLLGFASPEVLDSQIPCIYTSLFALADDIVFPYRSLIYPILERIVLSEERVADTYIIKVDFLHLGHLLALVGIVWWETEYHKTLLKEINIALNCTAIESHLLSER